jgi:L-rhamnose mutarotase
VKTFGLMLNLQDDPAKIERYKEEHLKVWPGVTDRLRAVGITEMRIFLRDRRLFMYIETTDAFDPAVDWPRIQDDPVSKEWNVLMGGLQERSPEARPDEWWATMELVFDMSWPQHRPGGQA